MAQSKCNICGVYLAAGQSKRMGCNKLELPLRQGQLGSVALRTALQTRLDSVLVVVRQEDTLSWVDDAIWPSSGRPWKPWTVVRCAEAARGQAYSLRAGVRTAAEKGADAVVVMLADQPFITTEMVDALISRFGSCQRQNEKMDYIASGHRGVAKPPILFSASAFPGLLSLEGDEGARCYLRNQAAGMSGCQLTVEDTALFFDVDTKDAYAIAQRH